MAAKKSSHFTAKESPDFTDFQEGLKRVRKRQKRGAVGLADALQRSPSLIRSWARSEPPSKPSVRDLVLLGVLDAQITGQNRVESAIWWLQAGGFKEEEEAILRQWIDAELNKKVQPGADLLTDVVDQIGTVVRSQILEDDLLAWASACRMTQYAQEKERDEWMKRPGGVVVCILNRNTVSQIIEKDEVRRELQSILSHSGERQLLMFAWVDNKWTRLNELKDSLHELRNPVIQPRRMKVFIRTGLGSTDDIADRTELGSTDDIADAWAYLGRTAIAYLAIRQPKLEEVIDRKRWENTQLRQNTNSEMHVNSDVFERPWRWSQLSVKLDTDQAKAYFEERGFSVGTGLSKINPRSKWTDLDS